MAQIDAVKSHAVSDGFAERLEGILSICAPRFPGGAQPMTTRMASSTSTFLRHHVHMLLKICIALHAAHPVLAQTSEPKQLSGTYSTGPESILDPGPDEKPNTHVRFNVTGRAAADIYKALPGRAVRAACFSSGHWAKASGDIVCIRNPKGTYECWFGLDLRNHTLAPGFVC